MTSLLTTMWGQLTLLFASWSVLSGGIWKLFERVDKVANADARHETAQWLNNVDIGGPVNRFAASFAHAFDSVFGARHFSWKCFYRSCLASMIWSSVLFLFWGATHPHDLRQNGVSDYLTWWIIMTGASNLIPDYLSLLKTRYLIKMCQRSESPWRVVLLVLGDAVLSAIIAFAAIILGFHFLAGEKNVFVEMWEAAKELTSDDYGQILRMQSEDLLIATLPSFGIWYYTNFFSSVWLWLYGLSALLIRVGGDLGYGWMFVRRRMDIDKQPFMALAVVCISIVTIVYMVIVPVMLFKH
jgi:hypothetical protein